MPELHNHPADEHKAPLEHTVPVEITPKHWHRGYREVADFLVEGLQKSGTIAKLKDEITEKDVKIEGHEKELADALIDPVTKLPNRKAFENDIAAVFERAQKGDEAVVALGLGDLAFLKAVNDNMSHPDGDLYLTEAARALQDTVRPGDSVYRIGGDEFAILYFGVKPKKGETLEHLVGDLESKTEARVDHHLDTDPALNHIEFPMHMSVAFGLVDPAESQDSLMRRVDDGLSTRHAAFKDELRATGAFPEFTVPDNRLQ